MPCDKKTSHPCALAVGAARRLSTIAVASVLTAVFAMPAAYAASAPTPSPASARATDDFRHVQALRDEAENAWSQGKRSPASLKTALAKLEEAMAYLDRTEVRERADGNRGLAGRRHDLLFDLAGIHAMMGEKGKALDALEAMQRQAWTASMRETILQDDGPGAPFASLRNEPRFQAILRNMELAERLWTVPAIATPYREKLSVEERVAGLSLFWAEVRQNFAHFDHVPELAWDRVYLDTLTKVMAAETTREYYDVLMRLAPVLQDGHTNIYAPKDLADRFYARPPMRSARIGDKVLITEVFSPTLAARVRVGEEIVEIEDIPVIRYAEERVAPYASSSTPQDRAVRIYNYQLFSGDVAVPLKFKLRDAQGAERIEVVARGGYSDAKRPEPFAFRMLPGGIAYFALDHFESDAGVKAFEKALPEILKARALVIDLRRNGGGATRHGYSILSYLTETPIPSTLAQVRGETGFDRQRAGPAVLWRQVDNSEPYVKKRETRFLGPVAVLAGPQTFSAAEDFLASFDMLKRGPIVGEATGGSTGQPLLFKLPGGGMARICAKRDSYPDGRMFVGKGIMPTIEARETVAGMRAGRDTVLARALEALEKAPPRVAAKD